LTLSAAAAATPNDVLKALGTGETGLTASEAAARLFEAGANRLPEAHGPGLPRELAGQLFHFFALILWAAAGLALLGGLPELAVAPRSSVPSTPPARSARGWGTAVVVTTGERTRLGGIAQLTGHVGTRMTPLHREMNAARPRSPRASGRSSR
jgi:magnesium-transporting ATPase (P-type)